MTKLTSRRMRFPLQLLCLLLLGPLTEATQDVLTQHNDNQRTGATLRETVLNVSNANERTFGWRWDYQVEGDMYAQPLYVDQAPYRNERGEEFRKNVIYVATMQNLIYAFDADGPGSALWSYDAGSFKPNPFGQPVSTDDKQLYDTDESKYNIRPFVGITSTPVIDRATGTLYAVAMTKQGDRYIHRLHAVDIATGKPKNGLPAVEIKAVTEHLSYALTPESRKFESERQLQRPALALANKRVYVAWGSFADIPPYDGIIMSFGTVGSPQPLTKLEQFQVVITNPHGQGAIWQSGGGPAIDGDGFLYAVTGNGSDASSGRPGLDFDDSVFKLDWKLTGSHHNRVVDYYTPSYQSFLDGPDYHNDLDLGVSGPMVLPSQPGPAQHQYLPGCPQPGGPINLLAHGSKAGLLYLINRDCMGGFSSHADHTPPPVLACPGPCNDDHPEGCANLHIHATPVYWDAPDGPRVYTVCEQILKGGGLKAYTINGGEWVTQPRAVRNFVNGHQMSLSSDQNRSGTGIVWMVMPSSPADGWSTRTVNGMLLAFNAETLEQLWSSESPKRLEDRLGGYAKFNAPTIAHGRVFVATFARCRDPRVRNSCGASYLKVYGLRDWDTAPHMQAQQKLYMAWRGVSGDDALYWTSSPDGLHWDAQLRAGSEKQFGNSEKPSLAVFQDRLYMAWKGVPGDSDIYWSSSDGETWLGQAQVGDFGTNSAPSLAPYKGKLYMAWKGVSGDSRIWVSSFDGQYWAPQQEVSHTGTSSAPALAVFQGRLYMAWKGTSGDSRIWWSSSLDGRNWAPQQEVANAGTSAGPSLAVFQGLLYMAWKGSPGDSRIWWSTFNGTPPWASQKEVANTGTSYSPSLAVFNGLLYMAWKGTSGDSRIWWSSFNGTPPWAPQQQVASVGTVVGPSLASYPE